jgi:dTDP-4-amino-4,6-dideoxygalactose transaminase
MKENKSRQRSKLRWPPQTEEIERAFSEIFSSGQWWQYTGERVKRLESEFAEYHNCLFGVAVCNGSVAIDVALKALSIGEGDEVILPAYDFFSLPKSVLNVGATPVFADVCPDNFTIDKNEVKKKISLKTKAIIAVHISSSVAEMDAIKDIARDKNVYLIEDCAQAHGAIYGGKKVGSWGDLGIFSFGGIKLMTSGQGGMITTSDEDLYKRCHAIVNRGHLPGGAINPYGIIGENFQLSELQAAILFPQLSLLETYNKKREEAVGFLDQQLSEISGIDAFNQFSKTDRRAFMRYSFCYRQERFPQMPKSKFIEMLKSAGVPALGGYTTMMTEPRFQKMFAGYRGDFLNSKKGEEEIVAIHHPFLLEEHGVLASLVQKVKTFLSKAV